MSSVRICDRPGCETIFSENALGWGTFQGTVRKEGPDGEPRFVTKTLDMCPPCNGAMSGQSTGIGRLQLPPPDKAEREYSSRHSSTPVDDTVDDGYHS